MVSLSKEAIDSEVLIWNVNNKHWNVTFMGLPIWLGRTLSLKVFGCLSIQVVSLEGNDEKF